MLTREERDKLQSFIGYGRLDAPVWFLGVEEAGDGEERLKIRAQFRRVEDLRSAQTRLGYGHHFEGKKRRQPQWRVMADVMLRVNGNTHPDPEDRRRYQATRLGRTDGETLLIDLMHIPKPNIKAWNYPISFPEFPDANAFYTSALQSRTKLLTDLIREFQPPVIVAYGKAFWPYFEGLVPDANGYTVDGFNVRQSGPTLLVLTHMLHTKEMNGRTPALAEMIKTRLASR